MKAAILTGVIMAALSVTGARGVEIIAHRGASSDAPENTVAAMRLGYEQGADGGELDIHVSSDGHLVVIHDADTKRVAGVERKVAEQTLEELRRLEVGQWGTWEGRGFSEKIPTLEACLAVVPAGRKIFIEIKSRLETLPPLEATLKRAKLRPGQAVIITFHFEVAEAAKKRFRDIKVYWLHSYSQDKKTGQYPDLGKLIDRAKRARLDGLNLNHEFPLDRDAVKRVHDAGLKCYVWTVDDPAKASRLAEAGVDGITTNRPGALRREMAAGGSVSQPTPGSG